MAEPSGDNNEEVQSYSLTPRDKIMKFKRQINDFKFVSTRNRKSKEYGSASNPAGAGGTWIFQRLLLLGLFSEQDQFKKYKLGGRIMWVYCRIGLPVIDLQTPIFVAKEKQNRSLRPKFCHGGNLLVSECYVQSCTQPWT